MDLIVHYFALRRCGASTSGYLSPCHLDDGKRIDTGEHQDVTGGWHDASDLRKWVGATIYGMVGLAKAHEFEKDETKRMKILDEYWTPVVAYTLWLMTELSGDRQFRPRFLM